MLSQTHKKALAYLVYWVILYHMIGKYNHVDKTCLGYTVLCQWVRMLHSGQLFLFLFILGHLGCHSLVKGGSGGLM